MDPRSPSQPSSEHDHPPDESPTAGEAPWARVKSVFMAALDLPAAERAGFVAESCDADAALFAEVNALLASDANAGSFCETPAVRLLELEADCGAAPCLEPGTRLGTYEICEFLAAGGMGQVYRARHTVLGRDVAIKTVHPALQGGDAWRRLVREARHASMLRHPGVCTIHEIGDAGGQPFIVMQLIEGRSLSEVINAAPPALRDAVAWGEQIADAVEHAHSHGVVHRDLKSSNVMLDDDGRPVILDFGLARRVLPESGTGDSMVTLAGVIAGTVSHLAPEVLRGAPADVRSDVWSLGVLLYELATGQLPFHGRTSFETSSAILDEEPTWRGRRVPLALRLVIERCLAKDPAQRYPTAGDVRSALGRIRRRRTLRLAGGLLMRTRRQALLGVAAAVLLALVAAAAAPSWLPLLTGDGGPPASLAFLPLEHDAAGDPDAAFYAAGLTDGLAGALGAALEARLLSPGSAARLMATGSTPTVVARELGADAVITGRLRRSADRLLVDVRLLDARTGRVLWSESFERPPHQVLVLQADIVRQLAAGVRLALRPGAAERSATVRAVSPEAYEAYLMGRYEWSQRSAESLSRALGHFVRAIELDPTYAPAHAALADVYNQYATVIVGMESPHDYRPRAAAAAIRALQIDPQSAEAHAALGYVQHYDLQWDEAERSFASAIELNPSYPLAHLWLANLLMSRGRLDEALYRVHMARELDPYSLIVHTNIGWIHQAAGRVDEAVQQLQWTLSLDSTYLQARARLIAALRSAGRGTDAHAHAERYVELSGRSSYALGTLAVSHAHLGQTAAARALLDELLARAAMQYVPPPILAEAHDALGETEEAVRWLARAYDERSNYISYIRPRAGQPGMNGDPRAIARHAAAGLN
jgi:tetratricopeptide (TPR) repeat protein/tRNA A-37 threonylcarbamoyl transferase component Bud32